MNYLRFFLSLFLVFQLQAASINIPSKTDPKKIYTITLTSESDSSQTLSITAKDFKFTAQKKDTLLIFTGIRNQFVQAAYQTRTPYEWECFSQEPDFKKFFEWKNEPSSKEQLIQDRFEQLHYFYNDAQFEPFTSTVRTVQSSIQSFFTDK